MSKIKFKPCPFCGSENIDARYTDGLGIERCV